MTGNRHHMFVVPSFLDFPCYESMPEIMEVKVLYPSSSAGSMKSGLPSFSHQLAFPGKDRILNRGNLSLSLLLAHLLKDCPQSDRDRNGSFLLRFGYPLPTIG